MSRSEDAILAAINVLSGDVGALRGEVGALSGELGTLRGEVGTLREQVGAVRDEVTRLRVDTMSRLDRQQDALTAFKALLTATKDDMQVNIAAADKSRAEIKLYREEHFDLAHQLSIVHRRLIQLEQRFDARENGA